MIKVDRNDIRNLNAMRSRTLGVKANVKRKRKIRLSEKAMWLADLNDQIKTIDKLLDYYNNATRFDGRGNPVEGLRAEEDA